MPDPDLKLNTLSRYSKDSPHLIREEYGNCEIPAGCGGVVLRWRDPRDGIPVPVKLYTPGECQAFLDGEPLTSGRPLIPPGEHVLGLAISGADPRYVVLIFAAVYREPESGIRRSRLTGEELTVLSAADGTWKFTMEAPAGPEWQAPDFDDADWEALVENAGRPPVSDPKGYDPDRWRIQRAADLGAAPLGIPAAPAGAWERLKSLAGGTHPHPCDLWVRKQFTVAVPGETTDA